MAANNEPTSIMKWAWLLAGGNAVIAFATLLALAQGGLNPVALLVYALAATTIPFTAIWLYQRIGRGATDDVALLATTALMLAIACVMSLIVMLSNEPMAIISMLAVPPAQAVVGIIAFLAIWWRRAGSD